MATSGAPKSRRTQRLFGGAASRSCQLCQSIALFRAIASRRMTLGDLDALISCLQSVVVFVLTIERQRKLQPGYGIRLQGRVLDRFAKIRFRLRIILAIELDGPKR